MPAPAHTAGSGQRLQCKQLQGLWSSKHMGRQAGPEGGAQLHAKAAKSCVCEADKEGSAHVCGAVQAHVLELLLLHEPLQHIQHLRPAPSASVVEAVVCSVVLVVGLTPTNGQAEAKGGGAKAPCPTPPARTAGTAAIAAPGTRHIVAHAPASPASTARRAAPCCPWRAAPAAAPPAA